MTMSSSSPYHVLDHHLMVRPQSQGTMSVPRNDILDAHKVGGGRRW
jgi:hypothetical protein